MSLLDDMKIPGSNVEIAWGTAAERIRKHINSESELARVIASTGRRELYKDSGVGQINARIDDIFEDPANQERYKKIAKGSRVDNATKRIVNETSTVYMKGPRRWVGEDSNDENYQALVLALGQDKMMRRANQWINLHNEVLIWFRVSERNKVKTPVLEVFAPHQFWVISSIADPTLPVAYVINLKPNTDDKAGVPHYSVWTDTEKFVLNGNYKLLAIPDTNPFGRIPGIFAHREPPDGDLFDTTSGQDIIDADLSAWLINTLLIKETKSMTRQAAMTGDTSTAATAQSQDTEHDLMLPEGVSVQTLDRGGNLGEYRDTADHVINGAAANHGIPPSVRKLEGASSGLEVTLRERRLREIRGDQIIDFREHERELAEIQSVVMGKAQPSKSFKTDGWGIDYVEVDAPLAAGAAHDLFEKRRTAGLTSTVEQMRREDPDLSSDKDALFKMKANVDNELARNVLMRPLAKVNGSMGQSQDDAKTPEQNGAMAQEDEDEPREPTGMQGQQARLQ